MGIYCGSQQPVYWLDSPSILARGSDRRRLSFGPFRFTLVLSLLGAGVVQAGANAGVPGYLPPYRRLLPRQGRAAGPR